MRARCLRSSARGTAPFCRRFRMESTVPTNRPDRTLSSYRNGACCLVTLPSLRESWVRSIDVSFCHVPPCECHSAYSFVTLSSVCLFFYLSYAYVDLSLSSFLSISILLYVFQSVS